MEKLTQETVNFTEKNIDRIAALFPSAITETKDADGKMKRTVNFHQLRQLLSDEVVDGDECYEFTWVGKKQSIIEGNRPIRKTLRPSKEESKNWDSTENLYIEGDNLDVLKLLQNSYLNKVKMIYIDPPYNTGNDFVYRDNFKVSKEDYEEELGLFDEEENRLFKNTETNGRYHSDWCSMMYPRLQSARNLLTDDGVIFISIDDNEVHNLRKICDEVFGEENFVATFPWRKRTAKSDVPFGVSQDHEWILCFGKSSFIANIEGGTRKYYHTNDLPNRPWRIHDLTTQRSASERPNSFFTIVNPKTGEEFPASPIRTWAMTKDTFMDYYDENRIVFPGDYDFLNISKPAFRYFKDDDIKKVGEMFGYVPVSTFLPQEVGMSQDGTKDFGDLFNSKIFSYPKPVLLLSYLIKVTTNFTKNAIILDFFSGSATTAHAVMQLNAEDGGNRKFIMVQLPEETDPKSEAYKAGYKNICEIGKERIRRAGKKIEEELNAKSKKGELFKDEEHKTPDTGFRVLKVDSTNMKDVYYSPSQYNQQMLLELESNIKEDRTDIDLLYGVLLEWGVPLSLPHITEKIDGKDVHFVNDTDLVACFEEQVPEEVIRAIAIRKPLRVVFRDSSFRNSPDKINVSEIFKTLSPETTIKVI